MRTRRLVVDGETFSWSVRHTHPAAAGGGPKEPCRETLAIGLPRTGGHLRMVFRAGAGRLVPDGWLMPAGAVGTALDRVLNLHEPGAVRALLDVALDRGWSPHEAGVAEWDGWSLFDEAFARRAAASTG